MSTPNTNLPAADDDVMTTDLVFFDPATVLTEEILSRFDMLPSTFKPHTFKDEKTGQDQTYYTGTLTFDGLPPYFTVEGNSYGLQASNKKDDKKDKPESKPDFVQLPAQVTGSDLGVKKEKGEYIRKTKYQVSFQLTENAHPDEWTDAEKILINFVNDGLRKIYAHCISRHPEILSIIGSKIVDTVQEEFRNKLQEEGAAALYPDEIAQGALFAELVRKNVYTAVVKKVYRKKLKPVDGQKLDPMASPFDKTSNPALYGSTINFVNQENGEEIHATKYYMSLKDTPEQEMTHLQAKEYGRARAEGGVRFDEGYFGAQISPQLRLGEVIFKEKIAGGSGYSGRMIRPAKTARDPRFVKKAVTVQAKNDAPSGTTQMPFSGGQVQMGNGVPIEPTATSGTRNANPIQQVAGPQPFDPSAFNMKPASFPGVAISE
tara:strand:- start:16881 stop:18176 length:1296 start_codon:yes stop_codon:yes gene_type:complete